MARQNGTGKSALVKRAQVKMAQVKRA